MENKEVKKNYWAEVAKVFGVELEEKINLICYEGQKSTYSPYMFTNIGLRDKDGDCRSVVLQALIGGEYRIEKLPWKPKEGEQYWYFWKLGNIGADIFRSSITQCLLNYKTGNCFKTQEEAVQNKDKVAAMLKSDEMFKY